MEETKRYKDAELNKLLVDNRKLADELRQCQADKEFVWSLWKRLQVSSPDLTQAISTVMEREREKSEIKDRKVVEILQNKDEEIKSLHEVVSSLKLEKDDLFKSKMKLEVDHDTKTVSVDKLEKEIADLKELNEKNRNDCVQKSQSYERSIKEMESQREDLKIKIAGFLTDLQEMRSRMQSLEDENRSLVSRNEKLRDELSRKDDAYRTLKDEKESVVSELERVLRDYSQIKTGVWDDLKSRDKRYKELKAAYEDLTEHNQQQLVLIKQLQDLQSSTKEVLSEQEEAYRNEKKSLQQVNRDLLDANENLKEKEDNLVKENDSLRRRIEIQENTLKESEEELKNAIAMATGCDQDYYYRDFKDLEEKISSQRQEIASLQRKLKAKRNRDRDSRSPHHEGMVDHTFSPIIERGFGRQHARSRSLSPCTQSRQLLLFQKKLKATETKLDDTKQLLELKKDEVREIQRAHNKRLDRLKLLQSDYRSLKRERNDQDAFSPRKRSNRIRNHRSDPKELRQENSETVWNELARYKRDKKILAQEKLSLEEELDALRVQAAMDRATIHDLNLCIKHEKNDLTSGRRARRHDDDRLCSTPKGSIDGKTSSRSVKNLERKLENAAEDTKILKRDKKRLLEDNRLLKDDIKSLKMEVTDSRQSASKLRVENNQLRHQVERLKSDTDQFDGDMNNLRSELDGFRDESSALRIENHSLRDENRDLRQDVTDMKLEIADLHAEIKDLEHSANERAPASAVPKKGKMWKSDSAKRHQNFLNKSVEELQAAFGGRGASDGAPDPTSTAEDTLPDEVGRSDASSLGQSIVKVCRRQKMKNKELEDEEETLGEESPDTQRSLRPSARRPSSLPRHGGAGMVHTLKQRISSLQTQCSSLRSAKQAAVKKVSEEKEKCVRLESELTTYQNKVKNFKQTVQRLNREVEILQKEREDLQRALNDANSKKPEPQLHSDADYKYLESKLKLASGDVSRVSEQLKDTKKDLERKMDHLTSEKEKVTRLERDVSMKRQLIDELRVKSKENESKLKEEYNAKLDVEERLKVVEEDLTHKKNHIDSIRRQLQACTKEKAKYEMMYNKSREEMEKRCEQLTTAQAGKLEAENATTRLEQEAEHQLQTLASRSEEALEKLGQKLNRSEEKLGEFNVFVKNLSSHLIELLFHQRESLSHEKAIVSEVQNRLDDDDNKRPSSMSHAQKVACDILNMSRSDFEDLMAPVDASRRKTEEKDVERQSCVITSQDETWKSRVEKIASENPPFAKSLSRLIWDKVQDVVRITEEKSQVRIEHLEGELMSQKKF